MSALESMYAILLAAVLLMSVAALAARVLLGGRSAPRRAESGTTKARAAVALVPTPAGVEAAVESFCCGGGSCSRDREAGVLALEPGAR